MWSTRAGCVLEWARNLLCATILNIISTSCAYVRSLWCAHSQPPNAARDPPPRAGARSLNILTARKPTGLSARRRLRLLASHCMALTRECKNPSLISREIKIFSIFAWSVPTLVRINLKQGPSTYASEPQRRVRNFCSSLSEQSELWRALNFPSRVSRL